MGIVLVTETEKFTLHIMDCEFYYRRIPSDVQIKIREQNTVRGVVDDEGVMRDGFAYSLLGWGGKVPTLPNGEPADFNQTTAWALPDPVKARITANIFGTIGGEEVNPNDPLGI